MKYLVDLSDRRNVILFDRLKKQGIAEAYAPCDPYTTCPDCTDCAVIFSPAKKLSTADALKLPNGATVLGGRQTDDVHNIMDKANITYKNLLADEIYAVKNANLTAESTLGLIVSASEKSIFDCKILVLGLGRVAKALLILLARLSLNTATATFDKAELASASLYAKTAHFCPDGMDFLGDYDIIINTIPAPVLEGHLILIDRKATLIELASVHCARAENAELHGINFIKAPGLPSIYCPMAAADIMLDCIQRILK